MIATMPYEVYLQRKQDIVNAWYLHKLTYQEMNENLMYLELEYWFGPLDATPII